MATGSDTYFRIQTSRKNGEGAPRGSNGMGKGQRWAMTRCQAGRRRECEGIKAGAAWG